MKALIYSDVHGNLPAFEKMLLIENKCEEYICLGDLVNYGPWSNECVDLAISLPNSIIIKGNHEQVFIEGRYPGSNILVQDFFEKTYSDFNRIKEIKKFLNNIIVGKFKLTHTINDQYIYPDTNIKLDNNYIIGHSHHQFLYENNGFKVYNAGSVGQNRKYINEINYLIYEYDTDSVKMKSLKYDLNLLLDEMKRLNYSEQCLNYYKSKMLK